MWTNERCLVIPDAFADCLGGLLSVVGQNIDVAFEATNGATIKKLKTKFKVTEKVAGKSYTVTVGDIQSEEEKDLLCEISLSKADSDVDGKFCGRFVNLARVYFPYPPEV